MMFFGTLKIRETLEFVANLKYPQKQLDYVQKTLKLEKSQNTFQCNAMIKGISGRGVRKFTSIEVELVSDPFWILLDKPTSGPVIQQILFYRMVDLNDKTGDIVVINIIMSIILVLRANSYVLQLDVCLMNLKSLLVFYYSTCNINAIGYIFWFLYQLIYIYGLDGSGIQVQ